MVLPGDCAGGRERTDAVLGPQHTGLPWAVHTV